LKKTDANLIDTVRTRIYVTNIEELKPIGRAHSESFSNTQSATTMVKVERRFQPEMPLKMEADPILKWPNLTEFVMPYPHNSTLCLFITSLA
jgi:hypothetical protein